MGMPTQVRLASPPVRPHSQPAPESPGSPVRGGARIDSRDAAMKQQVAQGRPLKLWWEAHHLTLPVCMLAGGPPFARHLAATSRAFRQAVSEAWDDIARRFPVRLYVAGGLDPGFHAVDTVARLDPVTGTWQELPPLSSPRAGACSAVFAGRLYVLGGELSGRALRDAQRFDPWLDSWEPLPPLISGRIRAAAVSCRGYLYVLGGLDGSRALRTVERYDPRRRVWEAMPQMNRPRYACAAAVKDGKIIAFGGELTEAGLVASVERFDPEAGVWEMLTTVRAPSCGATVALGAGGSVAFTLGGLGLSGQALGVAEHIALEPLLEPSPRMSEVDQDTTSQAEVDAPGWSPLPPMPTFRHLASATGFAGGVVAVGGKGPTFEASRDVEFFNPDTWAWEVLPPLPYPRIRAAIAGGYL